MDKETSEIAKLTERISKDPLSKLFVPLAEEYKKAGDLEMSIHVLTEGLRSNPGYVTARSFLGKLLIEKGDLLAAQAEFEEVIKAVPDNLMAQRKLADLYAVQDRRNDSLKHYKIAFSLSPRDQELASLVADVEAGHDITPRLPIQKPKPQDTPKQTKPPATPVKTDVPSGAVPIMQVQQPTAASASILEIEVAEEVLVVEPLDPPAPSGLEQELHENNLEFLAEAGPETAFEPGEKETGEPVFDLSQPFEQVQHLSDEAAAIEEVTAEAEPAEKQADDFTTDTLAELYISQGFFEKAVDIYERMLVDNPTSQGLKDKLASVRAMAAESEEPANQGEKATVFTPTEFVPDAVLPDISIADLGSGFDDYVVEQVDEGGNEPLDDWSATEPPPKSGRAETPIHEAELKTFDASFEPVEYIPPDAVLHDQIEPADREKRGETTEDNSAMKASAGQKDSAPGKSSTGGRKETIDRLENWLQNIIKEK